MRHWHGCRLKLSERAYRSRFLLRSTASVKLTSEHSLHCAMRLPAAMMIGSHQPDGEHYDWRFVQACDRASVQADG